MFYVGCSEMEKTLRFGDVIQGFPICYPVVSKPSHESNFDITVSAPNYAVVLSPCCSISDRVLSIAPLNKLDNKLFSNPFFEEDPSRVNVKVPPEKSISPAHWDNLSPERKSKLLMNGEAYVFLDLFVYAPNDLLQKYIVHRKAGNIETGFYVVDFRSSIKISCASISNPAYVPDGPCKVLQLSVETREFMRNKIASFYLRRPDEDTAALAA